MAIDDSHTYRRWSATNCVSIKLTAPVIAPMMTTSHLTLCSSTTLLCASSCANFITFLGTQRENAGRVTHRSEL